MSWVMIGVIAAVLTFILGLIVQTATFVWKIAQARDVIRDENQKECATIRRECAADTERLRREFGEVGIAMRQKMTEMELYVRDNFVRSDQAMGIETRLTADVKNVGERLESRLLRMEAKIDRNHTAK